MKKLLCLLLTLILVSGCFMSVSAESAPKVYFDGKLMEFDVNPIIKNDRVLVPVRAIFEALGAFVTYGNNNVYSVKGDQNVFFEIGSDKFYVNGEETTFDATSELLNDRTLVPLRLISETYDCFVNWDDSSKTVFVEPKKGELEIKSVSNLEMLKTPKGKDGVDFKVSYPVITGDDEFTKSINDSFKKKAEDFRAEAEESLKGADSFFEMSDIKEPYGFEMSYTVNTNRKGLLSITFNYYYNLHGAHPSTVKITENYDIKNKKKIESLDQVLKGSKDEINETIFNLFKEKFSQEKDLFDADREKTLRENLDNVNFRLYNGELNLYFQLYDVMPYAYGYPETNIVYNPDKFILDLGEECLNKYTFTLDGNSTTGYDWILEYDDKLIDVSKDYKTENENVAGSGGTYTFNVTAKKSGNGTLTLKYMRPFESKQPLKTKVIKFFADKDLKITLVSDSLTEN